MTNILVKDFLIVLLIFLRITSAFIAAPVMGHKAFPMLPKLFLAFLISYMVFLSIKTSALNVEFSLWWISITGLKEILSGLLLGFMLNLVFYGVSYAGTLIGLEMGLSVADAFNPMDETQNNIIGEAIYVGAILIFFLINGHHYIIRGVVQSFKLVGIGDFTINKPLYELVVKNSAAVFVIAVKIASPIIVSFFLVSIAEAILARVIPQMQIFFVTEPLRIGLGFFLLATLTPLYIYAIKNLLKEYEDGLFQIIKAMGS
ncbi:MAG TPA: flagellar biosynthetic protein FliR [Ignavibacteriaceae bacterium]|nr:flagellar biosynthetic protein FliR [Ignavibacteriaceae bacterium]